MSYEKRQRHQKYFVYMRVSVSENSPNNYKGSLINQEDVCLKIAKNLGLKDAQLKEIQEDVSSFKSGNRPEFTKMIDALYADMKAHSKEEERKYGGIIFYKVDRLARNPEEFTLVERLFEKGYELISATETIENTPTGKLLFRMLSSFAIYESEQKSSRQLVTQLHNMIKGKYAHLGAKVPYGYIREKAVGGGNDVYYVRINPNTAEIIKTLYLLASKDYVADGKLNKKDLAKRINDKYGLKKKEALTERHVSAMLANDHQIKYNGVFTRKVTIKDKIVQDYMKRILESDDVAAEIAGTNFIGGKMKFTFHLPDFQIMSFALYDNVSKIVKEIRDRKRTKAKGRLRQGDKLSLIYSIGYAYNGSCDSYTRIGKPDVTKGRYINHKIHGKSISEKKILTPFWNSSLAKSLKKVRDHIDDMDAHLQQIFTSLFDDESRRLHGEIMWRQREYSQLLESIKQEEGLEEKEVLNKISEYATLDAYHQSLAQLHETQDNLIAEKSASLASFIDVITVDDIQHQPRHLQKVYFSTLFEKIAIHDTWEVSFYPRRYYQDLLSLKPVYTWKIT